jgi:hypothetical protein
VKNGRVVGWFLGFLDFEFFRGFENQNEEVRRKNMDPKYM